MKFLGFLSVALALSITGASASTVTLSQSEGSIFGTGGYQRVNSITSPVRPPIDALAGGFRVQTATNEKLILWCLDVAHNLFPLGTYETTNDPFSTSVDLSAQQILNIEKLFEVNYSNPLLLTDNALSAGFQMALWEIVYEPTAASNPRAYNISSGSFRATPTTALASSAAANFLASLVSGVVTQAYRLTFYESFRGTQNLVGVTAVPLPAAALLLGSGLAGLFAFGRRRRNTAA